MPRRAAFRATSKRTRIETGWGSPFQCRAFFFQSNIQENKDWNFWRARQPGMDRGFQSNIQENKDWNFAMVSLLQGLGDRLSEQHPREQGLKHISYLVAAGICNFQSNIQENKDWNRLFLDIYDPVIPAFRATSKRTRIETGPWHTTWPPVSPFRATSKRTRIETRYLRSRQQRYWLSEQHPREQGLKHGFSAGETLSHQVFQSNIQENKDWNFADGDNTSSAVPLSEQHPREQGLKLPFSPTALNIRATFRATSKRTRIETTAGYTGVHRHQSLSEQHPREQGLKRATEDAINKRIFLSEQHPREQGLKPSTVWVTFTRRAAFRATSKRTRIETYWLTGSYRDNKTLSEQHPREQGLKPKLHG